MNAPDSVGSVISLSFLFLSMSRTPSYLNKLPSDLAEDPFWRNFHKPPSTSFGGASRKLARENLAKDSEYHLREEIEQWEPMDAHLVHHGRLQVESRWGKVTSAAPGDYVPDGDKRSKMPSFPTAIINGRKSDHFEEEVALARTQPLKTYRIATADAEKQRKKWIKEQKKLGRDYRHPPGSSSSSVMSSSHSLDSKKLIEQFNNSKTLSVTTTTTNLSKTNTSIPATNSPPKKTSEFRNINVEDMRKALLPAPGQYETHVYHKLHFERSALPLITPKENIGKPRPKIDLKTLEIVEDENKLFDGSYFQYEDPTKKAYPAYTLGAQRPYSEREYCRVGPGDYNDPTMTGVASVLSTTEALKAKSTMTVTAMRQGLSSHSFGRRTLLK